MYEHIFLYLAAFSASFRWSIEDLPVLYDIGVIILYDIKVKLEKAWYHKVIRELGITLSSVRIIYFNFILFIYLINLFFNF